VLNLNRVAVLLGVYSNLPWIIGGYYASATMLARRLCAPVCRATSRSPRRLFELSVRNQAFWHGLAQLLRPLLLPFFVGSMIGCTILAAIAYPVALAFVRRRRHLAIIKHRN